MSRTSENRAFVCLRCGLEVVPLSNGSYRNHCPRCLYSKHLDVAPGDRASFCEGMMEPIGVRHRSGKGLQTTGARSAEPCAPTGSPATPCNLTSWKRCLVYLRSSH